MNVQVIVTLVALVLFSMTLMILMAIGWNPRAKWSQRVTRQVSKIRHLL